MIIYKNNSTVYNHVITKIISNLKCSQTETRYEYRPGLYHSDSVFRIPNYYLPPVENWKPTQKQLTRELLSPLDPRKIFRFERHYRTPPLFLHSMRLLLASISLSLPFYSSTSPFSRYTFCRSPSPSRFPYTRRYTLSLDVSPFCRTRARKFPTFNRFPLSLSLPLAPFPTSAR